MGFKDYILQLDLIGKAPTLDINNQLSVKTFVGSIGVPLEVSMRSLV